MADRVDDMLKRIDKVSAVEAEAARLTRAECARLLSEFETQKAREILPAFRYFEEKSSTSVSFRSESSEGSAAIVIAARGSHARVTFRFDTERQQVEVRGPFFREVGLSRQIERIPLYMQGLDITEGWVRDVVEKALEELVSPRIW